MLYWHQDESIDSEAGSEDEYIDIEDGSNISQTGMTVDHCKYVITSVDMVCVPYTKH